MKKSTVLRAILLNNEAVDLLERGENEGAIAAFTNSLEILRPLLAGIEDHSSICEKEHHMEVDHDLAEQSGPEILMHPPVETTCCSSGIAASQSLMKARNKHYEKQHFVFQDPITIPFEAIKSDPSARFFTKLSMVIIFNLALSFHLSALEHVSVPRLLRAKRLYEFAFQMHLQDDCDVTLLYSLALMNNLGLIYNSLSDLDRSSQCFEHMLATMMFLLESDDARTIKQWDGLLSNVIGLIFKEPCSVASAA